MGSQKKKKLDVQSLLCRAVEEGRTRTSRLSPKFTEAGGRGSRVAITKARAPAEQKCPIVGPGLSVGLSGVSDGEILIQPVNKFEGQCRQQDM